MKLSNKQLFVLSFLRSNRLATYNDILEASPNSLGLTKQALRWMIKKQMIEEAIPGYVKGKLKQPSILSLSQKMRLLLFENQVKLPDLVSFY